MAPMLKLFYTIGQAAALLGVSVVTVRRYTESNKIHCTRTPGGHRRFKHDDLFPKENDGLTLLYARVSSRDQKEDLARQVKTLQDHCIEKDWHDVHTIQDIGSGLNTRKPGLRKLIALVLARKVKRLVIMHKDRLLRFANDLLLDLCRHLGVEVVVLRHEEKDAQAQWCESIVEIMTVFCSSLYGKRSHKNRRAAAVQLAP